MTDTQMTDTQTLLAKLIACPSVTPEDAGCQTIIADLLESAGFLCQSLRIGDVDNLYATYGASCDAPLLIFAGHTDVVPTGPLSDWTSPPFVPTVRDGYLYGRGACDMKGALAAMVIAALKFVKHQPKFKGQIGFLITSDEEGPSIDGTEKVIAHLTQNNVKIDYAIVGEPSSDKKLADQIRIGRRGSLHGKLVNHGKQGHVAHPHLAKNPIHQSMLALHELAHTLWDEGNAQFPATTFQITNIHSGTGALNIIPGHVEINFNFRYSTAVTVQQLIARTEEILQKFGLIYDIEWNTSAEPFLTTQGKLLQATSAAIQTLTQVKPRLSTAGGTSDARFIAKTGAEVVELGVSGRTAHQVDECVNLTDLNQLTEIYYTILTKIY